eukprot:UN06970
MRSTKSITFKLKVWPSAFMDTPKNLEGSDKCILPERCLTKLLRHPNDHLPQPVIFQIESVSEFRKGQIHCGVLEFTAPNETAYIPNWMLQSLKERGDKPAKEGDYMRFRFRNLVKVSYAKFRPKTSAFSKLPTPKQTLEHVLSKFTTLTVGQTFPLSEGVTGSGSKTFILTVTKLKCEDGSDIAGCLVNTTLEVDFEEPEQKDTEDSQLVYRNTQSATLGKNKYFYFKLKIIKSNNDKKQNNNDELKDKIVDNSNKEDLIITLTSKKGHADMYIDTKRSDPTRQQHIWHSATCDDKQTLILKSEQLKDVSWIYIGVHAYKEETEFSIFVDTQEIDNNELKRKTMNKGNSLVANDSGRKDDPNYQMCDTCGRYISKMSMTMHSMTCARRNWHCKLCNKSFEVKTKNNHIHCKQCDIICTSENNLKKHTELKHDVQPCPMCKQSVPAETLKYHMSDQCEMRMIACQWCSMQITQASKLKHEEHCASQV